MEKKSKFFVIATPIGNLGDITFRAVETLKKVDLILTEDTRVSSKLLNFLNIKKPLLSYHQHSGLSKEREIAEKIKAGLDLALITDAGSPGISDPGGELVRFLLENYVDLVEIIPIPGPSALTTLISVSGENFTSFCFLGFPPNKKGRQTFFDKVARSELPMVYYDSPYRVIKNLQLLGQLSKEKKVIIGRELTKVFEQIIRGTIAEVLDYFLANPGKIKGEFTVAVLNQNQIKSKQK